MNARQVGLGSVLLATFAASGCARQDMYQAPLESDVQVRPASIEVGQSSYFYSQDNLGMAFLVDTIVTSTANDTQGLPLGNIRVEAIAPGSGVYLLPESAVTTHDFTTPDNWDQIANDVCYDANGNFVNSEEPLCAWLTDETTGNAFDLSDSFAQPEDWAPNYLQIPTAAKTGIARFWVFVDALPYSQEGGDGEGASTGDQGDTSIFITTGVAATTLTIQTVN